MKEFLHREGGGECGDEEVVGEVGAALRLRHHLLQRQRQQVIATKKGIRTRSMLIDSRLYLDDNG